MTDRLIISDDGDVETAVVAEFEATRRHALRRALAVGGLAIGASMVPTLLSVRDAFALGGGDNKILEAAIALENTAIAAYGVALSSGRLDGPTTRVAKLFKQQETQHRDALSTALSGLGGTPPSGPDASLLAPLRKARTQADIASFAIALETMAVAAYYDAQKQLHDAKLLQTTAQIMANEGQHLVVLRQALNRDPVPNAFENGKASK